MNKNQEWFDLQDKARAMNNRPKVHAEVWWIASGWTIYTAFIWLCGRVGGVW